MQHLQFLIRQIERGKAHGRTAAVPKTWGRAYVDARGDKTVHVTIDRAWCHAKMPRKIGGGV